MSIHDVKLGTINQLSLKELVGGGEQSHFTPWLSENLDVLGDALGISMECLDTELYAGDGKRRADMLIEMNGRDLAVVENQYGKADESHGWRTLHYALSLGAKAAFWIFEDISSDDERLISFLNGHPEINIVGIHARIYRIDDSLPAVDFQVIPASQDALAEIVAKSRTSREMTQKELFYGDYFPTMLAEVHGAYPSLGKGGYSNSKGKWNYYCSWNSALGCRNPWEAAFSQRRGQDGSYYVHLMLRGDNRLENFQHLREHAGDLCAGIPATYHIDWDFDPSRKSQKIRFVYPEAVDVSELTHDQVRDLIDWTCKTVPQLQKNLSKIVAAKKSQAWSTDLKVASSP